MIKHPAAIARDAWLESDEGKRCCAGAAEGEYLQNRLEAAFSAGYAAGDLFMRESFASALAAERERREKAEAERDELLASYQKVVSEHNGLVLAGDALLAKAGEYRAERDALRERCGELESAVKTVK